MWNKRNRKQKGTGHPADTVARLIANSITVFEKKVVRLLQRWESRFTNAQKIIMLAVFIFISGTYCSCIFFSAFSNGSGIKISDFRRIVPLSSPPVFLFKDSMAKQPANPLHKQPLKSKQ